MYNRYIRNDRGVYTRIPEDDPPRGGPPPSGEGQHVPPPPSAHGPPPPHYEAPPPPPSHGPAEGIADTLRHLLDRLHLEHVDTGDLLLLLLLFLLFKEDADEELLIALGLLLIL